MACTPTSSVGATHDLPGIAGRPLGGGIVCSQPAWPRSGSTCPGRRSASRPGGRGSGRRLPRSCTAGSGRRRAPGSRRSAGESAVAGRSRRQADADPVFVDVVGAGVAAVGALLLVVPALGDLDLTVAAPGAVADHEVVAAAVVAQDLAVLAVDLVVVAAGRGAVVQDDVLPRSVGLVGIEELIGIGFVEIRLQPLGQAARRTRLG